MHKTLQYEKVGALGLKAQLTYLLIQLVKKNPNCFAIISFKILLLTGIFTFNLFKSESFDRKNILDKHWKKCNIERECILSRIHETLLYIKAVAVE